MIETNILKVLDELGALLIKYNNDIKYKDYEIKRLKNKIESIESYIDFYSDKKTTKECCKKKVSEGA